MSNQKSTDSKELLYKCDTNYIKQLNLIRKQFGLIELTDEEDNEEENVQISVSPPTESTFNMDLYNCDNSDMEKLNVIRKQLNLEEIKYEGKTSKGTSTSKKSAPVYVFEGDDTSNFDKHLHKKKSKHKSHHHKKKKKEQLVEVVYSPPCKRIRIEAAIHEEASTSFQQGREKNAEEASINFQQGRKENSESNTVKEALTNFQEERRESNYRREEASTNFQQRRKEIPESNHTTDFSSVSSPSEISSPVKSPARICRVAVSAISEKTDSPSQSPTDDFNFCSLNVPTYDDKEELVSPSPTMTIISDNESKSKRIVSLYKNKDMTIVKSPSSKFVLHDEISSHDLPRRATDLYDFPILANIYHWKEIFNKPAWVTKNLEAKLSSDQQKIRYSRDNMLEISISEVSQNETKQESVEISGISSTSPMSAWREKQNLDFDHYNVVSSEKNVQNRLETEQQNENEKKKNRKTGHTCSCLRGCFGKRKRNFFR